MTTAVQPTRTAVFAEALDTHHDHAAPTGLVVAPSGHAVASVHRIPDGTVLSDGSGLFAATPTGVPSTDTELATFREGLARLHLQTVREMLSDAVARLGGRTSGGADLLHRQLVQGSVADIALAIAEAAGMLDLPGGPRWDVAERGLAEAGRALLKLYGASSMAADGPGGVLYVCELLGRVYLTGEQP
ncbi:acyl-CoA dehydrogenase family protein [Actinosynnema sp. CA-299493]